MKKLILSLVFSLAFIFGYGQTIYTVTPSPEFLIKVAEGEVPGHSLIHKFGAGEIGTSLTPVTQSGYYKTPTSATALEVVSSSGDDSAAGVGARKVKISGLYGTAYRDTTFEVSLNGATPVALPVSLHRLYRWYVSESGSYATQTGGSHRGSLTIQESGGGSVWSVIGILPFPFGQSQIGVYSIPKGYTGYLLSKNIFVDGVKTADVYMYRRDNIDDVSTPYSGTMRIIERQVGVTGGVLIDTKAPKSGLVGPCDIGFMAVTGTGTVDISVEFELLLIQN